MKKGIIIIPCAGKSKRYPNLRPKFLLVNPNGNLVISDVIKTLNCNKNKIIVTILKEHQDKYNIKRIFQTLYPPSYIDLCILDKETSSQSETIYNTLKIMNINQPFLIKDSDNLFNIDKINESYSYVVVEKLDNMNLVNPSNKSYVQFDSSGLISNIEEKKVISNNFSVGGYFFVKPEEFILGFDTIRKYKTSNELYISMIINFLIFEKQVKFKIKKCNNYIDLGTLADWNRYKKTKKIYFIDIDGIIVKNGSEYFEPYWGTTTGLKENIKVINSLFELGNQIILTTTRKEKYRDITLKQLKKIGLKFHRLIMALYHSQRVLINDFSNSNPYPSAVAFNIPRDLDILNKYIS